MTPEQIAEELEEEVIRRKEYYGLDNWPFLEVVSFVVDRLEAPEGEEES